MNRLHIAPLTLALLSAIVSSCGGEEAGEAPEIVSFSVDRMSIAAGETVTLSWDTKNGKRVSMSSTPVGLVMLNDLQATATYMTGPLTESVTFKLSVISESRETVEKTLMVTVSGAGILSFTATPATIMRGEPVTLAYMLAGQVTSTKITNSAGTEVYTGGDALTATTDIMPDATTTFTLTVTSPAGSLTAMAMVTVTAVLPKIDSFSATEAITGEPVTVAWRTTDANEVQVSLDGVVRRPWNPSGAAAGNVTLTVNNEVNTFKLEARNPDGMVEEELIVMARQRPLITSFMLTPESYNGATTPATLTWTTEHATSVALQINNQPIAGFPTGDLSGTYNFTVSGGNSVVKLIAINPAATTTQEGTISEGFIEPEPNDTVGDAIPLAGDGVPYRGTLGPDDLDMYVVEVPMGGRIYASAGVSPAGQCTADTAIRLIGPDGVTTLGMVDDVDFPDIGTCAELNPAPHDFADALPGGTYYISIEPGITHMGDDTYSLVVRVSGPEVPLPGINYTEVGAPPWYFSDCQIFSAEIGTIGNQFLPFIDLMDEVFRPLHVVSQGAELLNEVAHTRDYDGEIIAALRARGYEPKTQFTTAEFTPPNGLGLFCMMVPTETATVGDTFDAPGQLMVPHALFPMSEVVTVTRNGQPYGTDFVDTRYSFVDLGLTPPGEGLSHRIFRDIESSEFAENNEPPAGSYSWRHTVLDINGDGWQVEVNFEVQ